MPDTKIFVDGACVDRGVTKELLDEVPGIVAEEMSCWVWGWKWPFITYQLLNPENVDVTIFWDGGGYDESIDVFSNTQIIVEVAAYNFLDRRRNLNKRIIRIARRIKAVADNPQDEDFTVTITFIPVRNGYWARA